MTPGVAPEFQRESGHHPDRPLSALLGDVPRYPSTPEIRVDCPDEIKFEVVAALTDRFRRTHEVITVDGARILFEDGWGLVRASNTQAALVLRAEARTPSRLEEIKRGLQEAIARFPAVGEVRW